MEMRGQIGMEIPVLPDFTAMVTGHRPDKLFGYDLKAPAYAPLRSVIGNLLNQLQAKYGTRLVCVTGMALGADTLWAQEVLARGIRLHAYLPCLYQDKVWRPESKREYLQILALCEKVLYVSEEPYIKNGTQMQDRNVAMCNVADLCLAVYDGSKGGTDNCVKAYRQKSPRHLIIYHPRLNTITVEKG